MTTSPRMTFGGALLAAGALLLLLASPTTVVPSVAAYEYGDSDLEGHYFTYPHASGNRVIPATTKGTFPENIQIYDVDLPAKVTWSVGTHHPEVGFKFVVTTRDNKAYSISRPDEAGQPAVVEELWDFQAGGDQPPLVKHHAANQPPIVISLPEAAKVSPLSHPVPSGKDVYAFIDTAGDLVLWNVVNMVEIGRMAGINALPDGRIVRSVSGQMSPWLALYAGAAEYADRCGLGDCIEGTRLLVVQVHPQTGIIDTLADVTLRDGDVFEGLCPMFITADKIVATVTNSFEGSFLRLYSTDGTELSNTATFGWDGWHHQLFYHDFGTWNNPLPSFVDVRGPHSEKELQFFDLSGAPFWNLRSAITSYNTHVADTRYVDTSVSGDLNGDGINEAVVPTQFRGSIAGIQLQDDGNGGQEAVEVWRLEIPGDRMTSNLAAVGSSNGSDGIALGTANQNTFRMWLPLQDGEASTGTVISDGGVADDTVPPTIEPFPPTAEPYEMTTENPTKAPTATPTYEPTYLTYEPTQEQTPKPTVKPPTFSMRVKPTNKPTEASPPPPKTEEEEEALVLEKEMQDQFKEMVSEIEQEEQAQEKRQAVLLGTFMGIGAVLLGMIAFLVGRRRSSRKELDTAATTKFGGSSINTSGVADVFDAEDGHANEEEEEDLTDVQLDRRII